MERTANRRDCNELLWCGYRRDDNNCSIDVLVARASFATDLSGIPTSARPADSKCDEAELVEEGGELIMAAGLGTIGYGLCLTLLVETLKTQGMLFGRTSRAGADPEDI
eukprot:Gregarina_sp_Poly_1__5660@NODE_2988_length_1475_cov_6_234375_g1889_i0_p1_GENE_NODE_2988_length_1475_cov_6_234375_g1889_i0NODE_2988_length_1475_cov_6_234375_g1889_i0_p1_ORF_typecomplete_len109_score3_82_NODE_2988_length_1475_cov_6_234375_g1889_i0100426